MTRYRLTPAAQRDLSSIWDYPEERGSTRQAETYVLKMRAAIERIADDRRRGRTCEEIRPSCRRYGIGSHVLFYMESADGVDVIRILHQRTDPTRHL